jgi:hypothetical protein
VIDLNPLVKGKPIPLFSNIPEEASGGRTHLYDPCRAFTNSPNCVDASMCQKMSNSDSLNGVGSQSSVEFIDFDPTSSSAPLTLRYTYWNHTEDGCKQDKYRHGEVHLVCNLSVESDYSSVKEDPSSSCVYKFTLTSQYACPFRPTPSKSSSLSPGSILLIVFFVCVFVYIVGGILFLRYAREARGIEQIPNYTFWIHIPGLIKDGCLFVFSSIGICRRDVVYEKI